MPFWDKLEDLLPPDRISSSQEERYVYRTDSTKYNGEPDLIVNVTNQKEVLITVNFASKNEIPIIPRGAGSGMSGFNSNSHCLLLNVGFKFFEVNGSMQIACF